jgi:hypothetical protein
MVVNVFNVHLVIMFVHVLIHIVVLVVKVNDLPVMVSTQKLEQLILSFFDSLGSMMPPVTTVATTLNPTCSSNLCNNRGTCQQSGYGTGIQCYCLTGWSGSRCQYSKFRISTISLTHDFDFFSDAYEYWS